MADLLTPARSTPRHLGTIIGLLIGIACIASAILLDRADEPRALAYPAREAWIPAPLHAERGFAKLETGDRP